MIISRRYMWRINQVGHLYLIRVTQHNDIQPFSSLTQPVNTHGSGLNSASHLKMLQIVFLNVLGQIIDLYIETEASGHNVLATWSLTDAHVTCVVPVRSWSWCWGQTGWRSLWWWTDCQTLPACPGAALPPADTQMVTGYWARTRLISHTNTTRVRITS